MFWEDACACPRCELPRKRARPRQRLELCADAEADPPNAGVSRPAPVGLATIEPLFVLERLAHIRCVLLTLSAPAGFPPIARASVRVSGSAVTVTCDTLASDESSGLFGGPGATGPDGHHLSLQLDLGEPLGGNTGGSVKTAQGYTYVRLPLQPVSEAKPALTQPQPLGGASASAPPDPEERSPREESGLCRRAAQQRRRERRELPGAALSCRRCGASWFAAPSTVRWSPSY